MDGLLPQIKHISPGPMDVRRWLQTMVKLAVALYAVVGLGWSAVISTQRAVAGWDPLDGVFLVRAVLRALSWPVDAAVVTELPVVGIASAFVLAIALLGAVASRRHTAA